VSSQMYTEELPIQSLVHQSVENGNERQVVRDILGLAETTNPPPLPQTIEGDEVEIPSANILQDHQAIFCDPQNLETMRMFSKSVVNFPTNEVLSTINSIRSHRRNQSVVDGEARKYVELLHLLSHPKIPEGMFNKVSKSIFDNFVGNSSGDSYVTRQRVQKLVDSCIEADSISNIGGPTQATCNLPSGKLVVITTNNLSYELGLKVCDPNIWNADNMFFEKSSDPTKGQCSVLKTLLWEK